MSNPFEADKNERKFIKKKTNLDPTCVLITIFTAIRYVKVKHDYDWAVVTRLVLIFLWALKS